MYYYVLMKRIYQSCMHEFFDNALLVTRFTVSQIDLKKVEVEMKHLYALPLYTLVLTHDFKIIININYNTLTILDYVDVF